MDRLISTISLIEIEYAGIKKLLPLIMVVAVYLIEFVEVQLKRTKWRLKREDFEKQLIDRY